MLILDTHALYWWANNTPGKLGQRALSGFMFHSNAQKMHSQGLVALEKNYDIKFKAIFEAIHQLMTPSDSKS